MSLQLMQRRYIVAVTSCELAALAYRDCVFGQTVKGAISADEADWHTGEWMAVEGLHALQRRPSLSPAALRQPGPAHHPIVVFRHVAVLESPIEIAFVMGIERCP